MLYGTIPTRAGEMEVICDHFPYEGDSHDGDRYRRARPVDDGVVLLHGHAPEKGRVLRRQLNTGVDVWSSDRPRRPS